MGWVGRSRAADGTFGQPALYAVGLLENQGHLPQGDERQDCYLSS